MSPPLLVDIGSNLTDPVFRAKDPNIFGPLLERSKAAGVVAQILTGANLESSRLAILLAKAHKGLYTTVGCHPCSASQFENPKYGDPEAYLRKLSNLIQSNKFDPATQTGSVVAVGECGIDYDRLQRCPKETQLKYFPVQLDLAARFDLPLFLHSRAAHEDFMTIIRNHPNSDKLKGVVHSFDGTPEQAIEILDLGFYIGINGCSLKTEENIACVRTVPLDRVMVESDCPYCEVRPSHASHKYLQSLASDPEFGDIYSPQRVKKEKIDSGKAIKGRNEPAMTGQIAYILAELHNVSVQEVANMSTKNVERLFGIKVDTL